MELLVDGARQTFVPLKTFQEQYGLPESFGIRLFEGKDYTGLATIDRAGPHLHDLREALLAAIPETITLPDLMPLLDSLREQFRAALYGINEDVGLKPVEIEFAVAGFGDVNQALFYMLMQGRGQTAPDFMPIYYGWLDQTVRLSQTVHPYVYQGQTWQVQVVNHAYGRAGLRINTGDQVQYVLDSAYTCPAQGYMTGLMHDLAMRIMAAVFK